MFSLVWSRIGCTRVRNNISFVKNTCLQLYSSNKYCSTKKETYNGKESMIDDENKKIERAIALEEMLPTDGRGTKTQDHFGTNEKPRKVPAIDDSRFVGCTGHNAPNDHPIWWLQVTKEANVKCPSCGQVFQLEKIES